MIFLLQIQFWISYGCGLNFMCSKRSNNRISRFNSELSFHIACPKEKSCVFSVSALKKSYSFSSQHLLTKELALNALSLSLIMTSQTLNFSINHCPYLVARLKIIQWRKSMVNLFWAFSPFILSPKKTQRAVVWLFLQTTIGQAITRLDLIHDRLQATLSCWVYLFAALILIPKVRFFLRDR